MYFQSWQQRHFSHTSCGLAISPAGGEIPQGCRPLAQTSQYFSSPIPLNLSSSMTLHCQLSFILFFLFFLDYIFFSPPKLCKSPINTSSR